MNSVILTLFQYWRHRTTLSVTKVFAFFNFFFLVVSLTFVLEDKNLDGVKMLV